jgi:hypothetical protein
MRFECGKPVTRSSFLNRTNRVAGQFPLCPLAGVGSKAITLSSETGLAKRFGIKLAVTLLIDRDGKVADFHDQGLIDRQTLEMEIRTLLKVKSRRLIGN